MNFADVEWPGVKITTSFYSSFKLFSKTLKFKKCSKLNHENRQKKRTSSLHLQLLRKGKVVPSVSGAVCMVQSRIDVELERKQHQPTIKNLK